MAGTRYSARLRTQAQEADNPLSSASRAQAAAPRYTTRQRRGKDVAAGTPLPNSPPKQLRVQSPSHRRKNIARRGARHAVDDARSVASIPTNFRESSDYTAGSESEEASEERDEDVIEAQLEDDLSGPEEASAPDQHSLQADMMIESRQHLYAAAQDLYQHLCLENHSRTWDDLLHALHDVFNRWKTHYPTGRAPFLNREQIDGVLKGFETQELAISHVVSAANLVILLNLIHQVVAGEEEPLHLFETIDENFPWCIMASDSALMKSYEEHGTFERALRIRISHWVHQILATKDCTPEVAMKFAALHIFGTDGDYMVYPKEEESENTKFRPIYDTNFDDPNDEEKARMRVIWRDFDAVRQIILSDDGFHPERLRQAFPMEAWVDELSQWAKSLFGEVMKTIENEYSRSRTGGQAETTEGPSSETIYRGPESIEALQNVTKTGQRVTSRNATSGKRRRDEDTGEGDAYEFVASPPSKKPRSRVPRARATRENESTRAEDEDTEDDAPRSTEGTAEPPPRSTGLGTSSQKQPQKRIPWDKHDERLLQHWIRIHGSFWGHMEAMANGEKPGGEMLLVKRTQQQFRDKARNMKLDMLRHDKVLPKGFDCVLLGGKERDLLRSLGKNFDRREDDIEDGWPVNTEYVPEDE